MGESDSFSSGPDLGGTAAGGDFQAQVALEQQKLQLTSQVHKLNETCWDLCVGNPSSSLSGREENCLGNCVDRFIDTTLLITNRFSQLAQKMGKIRKTKRQLVLEYLFCKLFACRNSFRKFSFGNKIFAA